MREVINARFDERYVEETLENGLHVVLWHKSDYEKSYFMMATPLGALDMEQVDAKGNRIQYPAGIAHFLEHKMFEDEEMDVMEQFSAMGANVNAFTSYQETCYYFSTSKDIEKPLELLLDFVQKLSISDASVEKEKGIIIQELHMYKQMSDTSLLMELFTSLFVKHPMRYDIGGDDASVQAITKEQLEDCYRRNYHPQRMLLVGVTAKDPRFVMEIIKRNQAKKQFPHIEIVERGYEEEPKTVARKEYRFEMDVSTPKHAIAYKLEGIADAKKRKQCEWAIALALDVMFTTLNPDYQKWMDEGIINDYFGYEVDLGNDYGFIVLYGETQKTQAFMELIEEHMKKLLDQKIDAACLEQLKRRYYGTMVRSLNRFDEIAISFMRSYFAGLDFYDSIELVSQITQADIDAALAHIDLEQKACVHLYPKKSKNS